MALLSAEHLAGPGYIILNILRVINIITLSSVVASSIVMLVKTFIISKFFFFDATAHVVTALAGLFLVVSECSLFRGYFARNWPLLSPTHGFVTLGASMTILGLNLLGNMNKQATSQSSLGLPFWRLLLASGILAIVIGVVNIVASFIFRDKARNITARRVRSKGAITLTEEAPTMVGTDWDSDSARKAFTIATHHTGSTARSGSPAMRGSPNTSLRLSLSHAPRPPTPPIDMHSPIPDAHAHASNRFSQFDFNPLRAFRAARPSILPSYHSNASPLATAHTRRTSSLYSRSTSGQTKRSFWLKRSARDRAAEEEEVPRVPEISAPMNVNPQFAHLVRPDLAHHPSVRRGEGLGFDKI